MSARENAALAVGLEERARTSEALRAARRMWKAIVLARDLETLEALLRGEKVPVDRLDPEWLARLGRRRG